MLDGNLHLVFDVATLEPLPGSAVANLVGQLLEFVLVADHVQALVAHSSHGLIAQFVHGQVSRPSV